MPEAFLRRTIVAAALLGLLLAAACSEEPAPPSSVARLPKALCAEIASGLREVEAGGTFEYDAEGQATIEEEAWLALGPDGQTRLAELLAYHAACQTNAPPAELQVTIRSAFGTTLMQRVVELPNAGKLLAD